MLANYGFKIYGGGFVSSKTKYSPHPICPKLASRY
jgi:hypothetical protein